MSPPITKIFTEIIRHRKNVLCTKSVAYVPIDFYNFYRNENRDHNKITLKHKSLLISFINFQVE